MIEFRRALLAAAVALGATGSAMAIPFPYFTPGSNQSLTVATWENQYRTAVDCAKSDLFLGAGSCLAFNAFNDPVGMLWQRVNPALGNNLFASGQVLFGQTFGGDVFAGVGKITPIIPQQVGSPNSEFINAFTFYFAHKVTGFGPPAGTLADIKLGPTGGGVADPFGVITGASTLFQIYIQAPASNFSSDINTPTKSATFLVGEAAGPAAGYWGDLVLGANNGYLDTQNNLAIPGTDPQTINTFLGLDVIPHVAYNGGTQAKTNDPAQDVFGGASTLPLVNNHTCLPADFASNACTDFYGKVITGIDQNASTGAFFFQGNGTINSVELPEPGSVALVGAALAGLAFSRRRKSV